MLKCSRITGWFLKINMSFGNMFVLINILFRLQHLNSISKTRPRIQIFFFLDVKLENFIRKKIDIFIFLLETCIVGMYVFKRDSLFKSGVYGGIYISRTRFPGGASFSVCFAMIVILRNNNTFLD